jgi:hypothetical protein
MGKSCQNENPANQGGVSHCILVLSLGVWELRIGRPALLGDLARRLIARSAAAGLWISAARRAGHASTARIGLAGGRWPLLVHWCLAWCLGRCLAWRLALRQSDAARKRQDRRREHCRLFLHGISFGCRPHWKRLAKRNVPSRSRTRANDTPFSQWTARRRGCEESIPFSPREFALGRVDHRCTCLRTKSAEGRTELPPQVGSRSTGNPLQRNARSMKIRGDDRLSAPTSC